MPGAFTRRGTVTAARARRAALAVALALLAWPPLAWAAARALVVERDLARADAIAVLSGSGVYVERAGRAAELFREGRAPRVLLTNDGHRGGWSRREQRNPFFYERAAEELRRAGVPAASIEVLPQYVTSTYDEALVLREHAARGGLRSLLVVTSAYHTRRAHRTLESVFRGSGITVGMVSPPTGSEPSPPPATWWLHRWGWSSVAPEYPKMIYYWAHYW